MPFQLISTQPRSPGASSGHSGKVSWTGTSHLADAHNQANDGLSRETEDEANLSAQLRSVRAELDALGKKQGIGGMLAKLAAPRLRGRAATLTKQSADSAVRVRRLTSEVARLEQAWMSAGARYGELSAGAGDPDQWNSGLEKRRQLERAQSSEAQSLKAEIAELESRISGVRDQVLANASLVGCTCAKSTLDKTISARQFDTVVTDETSMVSVPQTLWCSSLAKSRFLCFGDFCQLPPISGIREQDDRSNYRIMHTSVFEQNGIGQAAEWRDDPRLKMLDSQYRMPDQICQLVSGPMYGGLLKTAALGQRPTTAPLALVSSSKFNAWSDKTDGFSWFNWHHAFVVVELVRSLQTEVCRTDEDDKILILTPFRAQAEVVKTLLAEAGLDEAAIVRTVWRSQGSEENIVIFDTVCAPPFNRPGRWFLDEPGSKDGARLLNVAATRAKQQLYVIAHVDYMMRHCPPRSLAALILRSMAESATVTDSRDLTRRSLPETTDDSGGYPVLTFPSGHTAVFDENGFVRAFAHDLDEMSSGSTVTVFSPFLNEKSVALWGPQFKQAIDRGCRVEIFTRRPGHQLALFNAADVEGLISDLESLGALVGYDTYIPGQRPMHHKIALLRFPDDSAAPIVWKGSMNSLGHYSSAELMDRTQSVELYNCLSGLLKLGHMQAALMGKGLAVDLEAFLCGSLDAICPDHNIPMRLKFARNTRFKSYFMSCPRWQAANCQRTVKVDVDHLNAALWAVGARCLTDGCIAPVEARNGRTGTYLRCAEGHFVNLSL